jgi:GNAT superfamily N-acetyltransferase
LTFYTFDHAMSDTLEPYTKFRRLQNLEDFYARLADGRLTYAGLGQMHSGRGLEAAWSLGPGSVVFPTVRLDLETEGLQALVEQLTRTAPGKRVILNEGMAPTIATPWEAAGWVLETHAVMAETDLTTRSWPLDRRVQERPMSELLAPALLELYAELARVGTIGDTGETDPAVAFEDDLSDEDTRLFVLVEDGAVLGAALLTPAPPGRGRGIHMVGVHPGLRGRGLGRALHASLLAIAAQTHNQHAGTTDWDNHAMRRIFERNGAVLKEQKQFTFRGDAARPSTSC